MTDSLANALPPHPARDPTAIAVATMSFGAAAIHFAVIADHFGESALFGVFFMVVAWLQVAWGVMVITNRSVGVLSAGAAGNVLVAAIWALSRTVGLPVGPEPGAAEAVGFADALATAFELLIVVGALLLIRARRRSDPASGQAARAIFVVLTLAVVGTTSASLALLDHHPPAHDETSDAQLPVVPQVLRANGETVDIEDVGSARVTLSPHPPRPRTHLTIALSGPDGHPLEGADVRVTYDMKMPHDESTASMTSADPGVYEADLRFFMGGRWNLVFDVSLDGERHSFAVEVTVPFG